MRTGPPVPPHRPRVADVRPTYTSTCRCCGATITYRSRSGRSLQGMADWWRTKHERLCARRSPADRRAWADAMGGENIKINFDHPGMLLP